MMVFTCPYCGLACDETELAPGGQAHLQRAGPDATDDDFEGYLFGRDNPKGVHFERWRHQYGCGKWFHAARDTVTMEVFGTYKAQVEKPPQAIVKIIKKRRPDWGSDT